MDVNNSAVPSGYSVTERDLTDYHQEFIMYTVLNNEQDYSLSIWWNHAINDH